MTGTLILTDTQRSNIMDQQVAAAIDRYKQWTFGVTHPHVPILPKPAFAGHPERNYNLRNKVTHHYLQHEHQTWGINLGWTDDGSDHTGARVANWFFARRTPSDKPLFYGEEVALGNGGIPSFIRYEHRTIGVNLGWSQTPDYQWKILGGRIGDPINTGDMVALYNEKSDGGECLVYFDRDAGGDIGWPSSRSWAAQFGDLLWKDIRIKALGVLLGLV